MGKNKNMKTKTESYVFRGFLAAENENRQLKDLPQVDFGSVPERFLMSLRTNAVTDNFVCWKLSPLLGFIGIQGMFWVRTYLRIHLEIVDPFIFIL